MNNQLRKEDGGVESHFKNGKVKETTSPLGYSLILILII